MPSVLWAAFLLLASPSISQARPFASISSPRAQVAKVPIGIGKMLIDMRAPGAPILLEAMENHSAVVGLFHRPLFGLGRIDIYNTQVLFKDGVMGHKDLIPPMPDKSPDAVSAWGIANHIGGFCFGLNPDGTYLLRPSAILTRSSDLRRAERAILRYFGVSINPNFDAQSQPKNTLH